MSSSVSQSTGRHCLAVGTTTTRFSPVELRVKLRRADARSRRMGTHRQGHSQRLGARPACADSAMRSFAAEEVQRSLTVGGVPWLSEQRSDWWDGAVHWIRDTVVRLGLGSSVEVSAARERPWSVTLSVRSPQARLFFKAVAPDRAYEVSITATLARRWPSL